MNTLTMAFRNVGRNKRRSLLAGVSVFLSILLIVVLDGFTGGFLDSMVRNYTKNDVGHVNVETAKYRARERFMPPSASILDSGKVAAAIKSLPALKDGLALVAERIRFGVILSSPGGSKAALGLGGDPALERRLLMLDRSLLPGSTYCDSPGTAILGEALAEDLGLKVGDPLKIVAQRADYGLGFKKLRVSGIFRSGVTALDEAFFQIGLADARDLLGIPKGASQVLVMLDDYQGADRAAAEIQAGLDAAGLAGLSAVSWTGIGDAALIVNMAGSVYYFMYLFVTFLGAFIIANIMMMVTLERRHEIGILKSMGMPPRRILGLFLAEGTFLGAAGAAAGIIVGLGLTAVLARKGFDMTAALAGFQFPMDNVIFPRVDPFRTATIFLLGMAVSAALSYLPARGAARIDPVEAIRSA
jgi:ABC-type lipoprotein release transport system permease subunit